MPEGGLVLCTCLRECKGGTEISLRKWYTHRPYRLGLSIQPLADFLAAPAASQNPQGAPRGDKQAYVPLAERRRKRRRAEVGEEEDVIMEGTLDNTPVDPVGGRINADSERLAAPVSPREVTPELQAPVPVPPPAVPAPPAPDAPPPHVVEEGYEEEYADIDVKREDIKITLEYIRLIRNATLDESGLDLELLEHLRNPPELELKIDDPDVILSIELFLATGNASVETYNAMRDAMQRHPRGVKILSHYKVKRTIEKITGIYSERHDMSVLSVTSLAGAPLLSRTYLTPICIVNAMFRNAAAAPLPNLLGTLVKKGNGGMSSKPVSESPAGSSSIDQGKKTTKMRVSKHKTARNLYAHMYIKENPATSVADFDKIWKSLDKAVLKEYDALREYALLCGDDSLDTITEAWGNFDEEERENYYKAEAVPKDRKGKSKAK